MKLIAYYRCSTKRQGESGLGLDAQKAAVDSYAKANGGEIVAEFTEVESGKRADRPKLAAALRQASLTGATLVVAKLDRLARNVAFLSALMESAVPFVACDQPFANRLTLHILAAVAEAEAVAISQRTKVALAQARRRGVLLGGSDPRMRNLTPEAKEKGRRLGGKANGERCRAFREAILPIIAELQAEGKDETEVAAALNARGYTTQTRRPWTAFNVLGLIRASRQKKVQA